MPDNRLTLANLREHFRKNIAIYIAGIAVMLVRQAIGLHRTLRS